MALIISSDMDDFQPMNCLMGNVMLTCFLERQLQLYRSEQ